MHELTRPYDGEAVMSRSAYDHLVARGRVNVLRPGKGLGSYALIEYRSLPERFRTRFEKKYGDPEKTMRQDEMPLAMDTDAQRFYHDHLLPNGDHLPDEKQAEYTLNARAVYGELAAKQLFARHNKTEMPTMRDSLWYGDGTKLNLFYKAVENGRTVVRTVSVYEVIDAYSETLLGYSVSASENFDAQFAAFRMAIETAGCKPYEIVTDNQGGQRSKIAQKFFANICRINRPTAPYNGPSKSIESAFGRFQQQVLHKDWRFTGGNMTSKEAWKINREFLEANKEKLFTYEEMLAAYAAARCKWNAMKHYRTGIAHEEMYRASANPATDPITEFDLIDLFWLTTEQPSLFTADGITVQYRNRKYTYEVLTADGRPDYEWRRDNTGREFFVKFDPQRMDRALLYTRTPMGLRYETVAYPYLSIRRNIQEQQPGDMELIRLNDEANKRERVRRQIEAHALELEHGVAPEQHGLRTPALKGISEKEYERLADAVTVLPTEPATEPLAVGEYTKVVSNMDFDPTAVFSRM